MSDTMEHPVSPPVPAPSSAAAPPPAARRHKGSVRRWLPWLFTLGMIVLIIVLMLTLILRRTGELPPPEANISNVATIEVLPRTHFDRLELPARLEADRRTVVSSELPGRVQEWIVAEGAAVAAGEVLLRLNTAEFESQLGQLQASKASAEKAVGVAMEDVAVAELAITQATRDAESLELELASAKASLRLASQEFERIKILADQNIATQSDLDRADNEQTQAQLGVAKAEDARERARIRVRSAAARAAQAEAGLALNRARVQEVDRQIESAQVSLAKMTISAPYAGRFDRRLAEIGDVVTPGQPLGQLYDLTHLRVAVDVPDRYAPLIDPDNPMIDAYLSMAMQGAVQDLQASVVIQGLPRLTGATDGGVELPAAIRRVAQAADPSSNTFRLELRLVNPGGALKEGIIAKARITFLRYDDALVIPLKALQVTERGTRVLVAEARPGRGSVARVREVEPISISGDMILVKGALGAGDRLIVSGTKGLIDGEEVNVVFVNGELAPDVGGERQRGPVRPGYGAVGLTSGETGNEAN